MASIAVTLLTDFLGAGKTTLLRHILNEQHNFRVAAIENEFGEISADGQLIGDCATQIRTLINGCICYACSNELEDALLDLLGSRDHSEIEFDRLVIECTSTTDPGLIIQTFFSHEVLCERYPLDGVIAPAGTVHADQQMDQSTIAQLQVGYADRTLLTKTDTAGDTEELRERLARINIRVSIYIVTRGDIGLSQLFNTDGFMLEEEVVSATPRFHLVIEEQNGVSSIVVELSYPVDISEASRIMENLLPFFTGQLICYKGILWIDSESNRLLFQGVQYLYSADWDRPWGDETSHSTLVFIGVRLSGEEIRAVLAGL